MSQIKNKVVLIGRPNTGKSTLFNTILHEKKAITSDIAGTTRDIIEAECEWNGKKFILVDTAGLKVKTESEIEYNIQLQAETAINQADLIIFVVDIRTGPTPQEINLAKKLRKQKIPIILAINKSDSARWREDAEQFRNFGLKQIPISSLQGIGVGDLLDDIASNFKSDLSENDLLNEVKIGIFGKPNAGKSSLLNKLIGEEKVVVSETPGTTRDAIDIKFKHDNSNFVIIDTAGIKRRARINSEIDKYSIGRSFRTIKAIDIALLIIDANKPITKQDLKIANRLNEENKGVIIIANKWDLILIEQQGKSEEQILEEFINHYQYHFKFLYWAPILFVSAKSGHNIDNIIPTIQEVYANRNNIIDKKQLGLFLDRIYKKFPPPRLGKKSSPQILDFFQISKNPPIFKIKIKEEDTIKLNYLKYIEKELRKSFGFEGTSIKIILSKK